ncbi:hypothetical protein L195_g064734, partial [Trifolium pratense]
MDDSQFIGKTLCAMENSWTVEDDIPRS